jgi:hypothetical protein
MNTNKTLESKNYIFHFRSDSFAHQTINQIIDFQEQVYSTIAKEYGFTPEIKINYYLLETSKECGIEFNKLLTQNGCKTVPNFQTNAFAWFPNMVYVTYSSDIQANGFHEDAHLLTYAYFNERSTRFIEEGISVAYDNYWLGFPLHDCSHYVLCEKNETNIDELIHDQVFNNVNDLITYPVAGSFIKWIKAVYGMDRIKDIYKKSNGDSYYVLREGLIKSYMNFIKDVAVTEEQLTKICNALIGR